MLQTKSNEACCKRNYFKAPWPWLITLFFRKLNDFQSLDKILTCVFVQHLAFYKSSKATSRYMTEQTLYSYWPIIHSVESSEKKIKWVFYRLNSFFCSFPLNTTMKNFQTSPINFTDNRLHNFEMFEFRKNYDIRNCFDFDQCTQSSATMAQSHAVAAGTWIEPLSCFQWNIWNFITSMMQTWPTKTISKCHESHI